MGIGGIILIYIISIPTAVAHYRYVCQSGEIPGGPIQSGFNANTKEACAMQCNAHQPCRAFDLLETGSTPRCRLARGNAAPQVGPLDSAGARAYCAGAKQDVWLCMVHDYMYSEQWNIRHTPKQHTLRRQYHLYLAHLIAHQQE